MAVGYSPLATNYANTLDRYLQSQRTAQNQFSAAAQPLQEAVNLFRVGGGYGAGQRATLEDEARRAKAEAQLAQVQSGVSSGSLATSTGLRIGSDLAKAKLGVEDTRTQFLTQALQSLSGLQAQQAGVTASTAADPYFNTFVGAQTQQRGQDISAQQSAAQLAYSQSSRAASQQLAQQQLNAQIQAQKVAQQQADQQLALQKERLKLDQQRFIPSTDAYAAVQF